MIVRWQIETLLYYCKLTFVIYPLRDRDYTSWDSLSNRNIVLAELIKGLKIKIR